MQTPRPKDFIAGLVIVAYFILKLLHLNGALDPVLFLILGHYFARRNEGADKGA